VQEKPEEVSENMSDVVDLKDTISKKRGLNEDEPIEKETEI